MNKATEEMAMDPARVPSLGEEFFQRIGQPTAPDAPSCLLFAFPKSGSVLLNDIFFALCGQAGLAWVDIPAHAFWRGLLNVLGPDVAEVFQPTGYCYGGWRWFPSFHYEIPILDECKSVLLVRDPRDMIVSHWFSLRHSHPTPAAETGGPETFSEFKQQAEVMPIDDYARLWAPKYARVNADYAPLKTKSGLKTYRYEDVIFHKREWVDDMLAHFGWSIAPALVAETVERLDIRRSTENVGEHIRQITPGDYKRKLRPDTIAEISHVLADMIAEYGYEPAPADCGNHSRSECPPAA